MKNFYLLMLVSVLMSAGCSESNGDGGKTPPPSGFDGPFALTVSNLRAANFTLDIQVKPEVSNYYVGVISTADAEADYGSDKAKVAQAFIDFEKENETNFAEVDDIWIFNGAASVEVFKAWALVAGTQFNIYVFGIGADGAITTEIVEAQTTRPEAALTTATFSVKVSEITDSGAVVSQTATDAHLPYFCDCLVASEIEGMTDDQIVTYVKESYGIYMVFASVVGNYTYDGRGYMDPDTKYYAVAFGYANNADGAVIATSAVSKVAFTTAAGSTEPGDGGAPSSVVIPNVDFGTVTLSNATDNSLTLSIMPNDQEMTYICFLTDQAIYSGFATPEALILDDLNYIADEASDFDETYLGNLEYYLGNGTQENGLLDELDPGTTYVAYAYGMSTDGKTVLSRVASSTLATTGVAPASQKGRTRANFARISTVCASQSKAVRVVKSQPMLGASARVKAIAAKPQQVLR